MGKRVLGIGQDPRRDTYLMNQFLVRAFEASRDTWMALQPHPASQDWSMVGWQEDPYQVVRHQHPYLHHLPLPHCLHVLLLRFSEVREESAWHWTRSSKRHLSHEPISRSGV